MLDILKKAEIFWRSKRLKISFQIVEMCIRDSLYVNGELDIDKIMSKQKRKRVGSYDMKKRCV